MNGISIVYITNRPNCKIEWFLSSLEKQMRDVKLEIIFVDYCKSERGEDFLSLLNQYSVKHVAPLPSAVQGPHKLTSINWFSASNARNTGFVYARYDYVAMVDDLSVLMPGWLDCVIKAANENYCVLGTYEKRNEMVIENGILVSSTELPGGQDSRSHQINKRLAIVPGSWFYGCSFGMPLETALLLGGFDNICDCIGTEDSQFGVRLKRTDIAMFFDRKMQTIESAELHFVERNFYKRGAFPCSKERYFEMLERYDIFERPERDAATYDAAWFIQDLLKYMPNVKTSMLNTYDLRTLHNKAMQGHEITVSDMNLPKSFWWTDEPFTDM
jgi:glycosyltransferase involved in cell wall biosynthesis